MNIDTYFSHYQIEQNPFDAEEARLDPIFERIKGTRLTHPDFGKILGNPEQGTTSIVFGEKGSGKTAIRLLISRYVREHNARHADRRVLTIPYDDLNPVLDKILRTRKQDAQGVLKNFRLEDHQDAVLSRGVTALTSALLGETGPNEDAAALPEDPDRVIRGMSRQARIDLAVLAALYDQPRTGSAVARWQRLKKKLRLGWATRFSRLSALLWLAVALTLAAAGLAIAWLILDGGTPPAGTDATTAAPDQGPAWLEPAMWFAVVLAAVAWAYWAYRHVRLWNLCRKIDHEMPAVDRTTGDLRRMLADLGPSQLARQPFPTPTKDKRSTGDARYQLTRRFVDLLHPFGYAAVLVLVDRVDEPTLISGNADKMKSVVWPMFDNKFLQQEGVGLKLLLPIELRHLLHRESPEFYQEARLDKQNMIDRLTWSGATLYDLCSARLRACRPDDAGDIALTDLFEEDVTRPMLIDALDQMHQPRDAFKFLYQVIQEHCRLVPEEEADYKVARLTLETVRKAQSQRVQELYRGLSPA